MFVGEFQAKPEANYVKWKHWQRAQYLKIFSTITWHSASILFKLYLSWDFEFIQWSHISIRQQRNKETYKMHELTNLTPEVAYILLVACEECNRWIGMQFILIIITLQQLGLQKDLKHLHKEVQFDLCWLMQLLNCPVLRCIVLQQHCHLERWGLQRVPVTSMLHDYFV